MFRLQKIILLSALVCMAWATEVRATGLFWADSYGSDGQELFDHMMVDDTDAIVIAGKSEAPMSLGGAMIGSSLVPYLFLARYDSLGNHLWSKAFFNEDNPLWGYHVMIEDIAVDSGGNIVIAGSNLSLLDFGGGMIGTGPHVGFVAVFDAQGNHLASWTLPFDAFAVTLDSNGDIVVGATFYDPMTVGGESIAPVGDTDIVLARYDFLGTYVDHAYISDGPDVTTKVTSVAARSNGEIVAGGVYILGSLVLGGVTHPQAVSQVMHFVAAFDASGSHLWSAVPLLGSSYSEPGVKVAVGSDESVYFSGSYSDSGSLFSDPVDFSGGFVDAFLAKLDASGAYQWGVGLGTPSSDIIDELALTDAGTVLITGTCGQTMDFGGGPSSSSSSYNVYAAELSDQGNHLWSQLIPLQTSGSRGIGVAKDSQGHVVLAAEYETPIQLNEELYQPAGLNDIFLAEFNFDPLPLLSVPQGAIPVLLNGDLLSVGEFELSNLGDANAGAFRCGYYLSPDSSITADDPLLASVDVAGVAAGAGALIPETVISLPGALADGEYYVGVFVDDTHLVTEQIKYDDYASTAFEYTELGTALPCLYSQAFGNVGLNFAAGLAGNRAVIGLVESSGHPAGAALLLGRLGARWQVMDRLVAAGAVPGDQFGASIAVDDRRVAILASGDDTSVTDGGAIYIYRFEQWGTVFEQKIVPPAGHEYVGHFDLDGDVLAAVHSVQQSTAGVLVYRRSGETWSLEEDVQVMALSDGSPLAVEGDVLVAGSYVDDPGDSSGRVRVLRFDGSNWNLEQVLSASPPTYFDLFGNSVAISGSRIAVVAPPGGDPGASYVFEQQAGSWVEVQEFADPGFFVAMNGEDMVTLTYDGANALHHHFNGASWESNSLDPLTAVGPGSAGRGFSVDQGTLVVPNLETGLLRFVDLSNDCNGNGVGDLCEIQANSSLDLDQNGLLDDCTPIAVPSGPNRSRNETALRAATPNPFNPATMITYSLESSGRVEISIFDLAGRRIRTLVDGFMPAGVHSVEWRGQDQAGRRVASGVYLYRMTIDGFSESRRMLLLK